MQFEFWTGIHWHYEILTATDYAHLASTKTMLRLCATSWLELQQLYFCWCSIVPIYKAYTTASIAYTESWSFFKWCYILSDYCNCCLSFQCPMKPIYNSRATKTLFMCYSVYAKTFLLKRKKWKSSMWSNNATYLLHKQNSKNYIWNIW